jgi:response regulator RpfG family c-di-GMP phosphodiesterase
MRMPGMDGAAFLSRVRQSAPDTVRMLLTGHSDMETAIAAVNEGQIFRFLTKPCPPERLLAAFEAAAAQNQLITAERVLLEQTLRGSINMLTDVLSLANPAAFGRATRIKTGAAELAKAAGIDPTWHIEVAAMLSQVGCVTLSASTIDKLYRGEALSAEEQAATDRLPSLVDMLLANIPRLEEIRACVVHQAKHFDGTGMPASILRGEGIPVGARILKIVLDFDVLEAQGNAAGVALDTMRGRTGWYDPRLVDVFASLRGSAVKEHEIREIPLRLVSSGMTFAEDVRTAAGALLLPRGYQVTEGLVERIRNFAIKGNVRMIVKKVAAG